MFARSTCFLTTLLAIAFCIAMGQLLAKPAESTLGMPFRLDDIYIPGSRVEAIPRKDRESSIVVRILKVKPAADGHRYDFEIYGLDPGTFPLADYLRYIDTRKQVTQLDTQLSIRSMHPMDSLPKPEELASQPPKKQGGYRLLMIVFGALWLVGLLLILFYRKKKPQVQGIPPVPSLHEKLQLLVSSAAKGDLDDHERSKLERLLLGHWKQSRPELAHLPPDQALAELRKHPDSSPLLLQLEQWLHAPNPSVSQNDVLELLKPFRNA